MPSLETIDDVVADRVAEITMRRAPVNAIMPRSTTSWPLSPGRENETVRAASLTSAFEAAFGAGMDLAMIRSGSGLDLRRFVEKPCFGLHDLRYRMGKPTIAALTGPGACRRRHPGRLLRRADRLGAGEPGISGDRLAATPVCTPTISRTADRTVARHAGGESAGRAPERRGGRDGS